MAIGWMVASVAIILCAIWLPARWSNGQAFLFFVVLGLFYVGLGALVRTRGRFSLKALLIGITGVAFLLGALGRELLELRTQRRAISRIVHAGGTAFYGHAPAGDGWTMTSKGLPLPDWFLGLIGDDVFTNYIEVTFEQSGVGDADLSALDFAHVDTLSLFLEPAVTDASMKHLGSFRNLQVLVLTGTSVTDDGLAQLSDLTNLRMLRLRNARITDAGLEHLQQLKRLRHLDLDGTNVTRNGIARLQAALQGCEIVP
jgi:hypothetical protein